MKPYEKLAFIYEKDWGKFSLKYLNLVNHVSDKFNFKPTTILDMACGTGDLASNLSENGYKVTGIDISPEMIRVAKARMSDVDFVVGDMTEMNFGETFDMAICAFDSLNYLLEDSKINSALSKVYQHLNKDGFFIFDINTPNLYQKKHHGTIDRDFEGEKFKQILDYDHENRLASTVFEFSKTEKEKHVQKGYTKNEMTKMLIEQNFKIRSIYEDLEFHEANDNSEKLFFVTQKCEAATSHNTV